MLGQVVMGYRIVREIGRGGMGCVYEAIHEGTGQRAAVKIMSIGYIEHPKYAERFVAEARTTAAIHHPGLVTTYYSDRLPDGTPYILMEYLSGEALDTRIAAYKKHERPIPIPFLLEIVRQISAAIYAVHQRGIVHRDLKPANLFLVADNEMPSGERVKVLDFGIAKVTRKVDEGVNLQTTIGNFVGTAIYASPEQCRMTGEIGPAADVYSLGIILYEMLAGDPPFTATHPGVIISMHLFQEVPDVRQHRPDTPGAVCQLLDQMLSKDPERRPSMEQIIVAIDRMKKESESLQEHPVPYRLNGEGQPASGVRSNLKHWFLQRIGAGFFVVVAAILLLAISGLHRTAATALPHRPQSLGAALAPAEAPALSAGPEPAADGSRTPPGVMGEPRDDTAPSPPGSAQEGEIRVGMTAGFNGPLRGLALHMKHGMASYFESVNEAGGIKNQKIRLIASDDRYEPELARKNVQSLVENHHIIALVGSVGTGTNEAYLPYLRGAKLPLLGPYTGSDTLRTEPPERYVFHLRASYDEETAALTNYFIEVRHVLPRRIAIFHQNDGYGFSGVRGVQRALRKRGHFLEPIKVSYERLTEDVSRAVSEVMAQREQIGAIIMICTARSCAKFIRAIRELGSKAQLGTISGSGDLAAELGHVGAAFGRGIVVTQVVPSPDDGSSLAVRYREQLQRHFPEEIPSFMSLEGYLVAALFTEAARRAAASPPHLITSEALVAALEGIKELDLGIGQTISLGPTQHQGLHRVWGMEFDERSQLKYLPDFVR